MSEILLDVRNLRTYFPIHTGLFSRVSGYIKAVDNVSFSLTKGETMGLVGESGCGKTTTGKSILRLNPFARGEVFFDGQDIMKLSDADLRRVRGQMQLIFQDPYGSLDPRMSVQDIVEEPLIIHNYGDRKKREERVHYLLEVVGLATYHSRRFPHEFSGGQRQRIGIARALALNPKLIVCDEPVSALDVSIQSQILNLLADLQNEFNLTYLFIAHGLSVVKHISDRIGVMYLGRIVEIAPSDKLHKTPLHPYTEALLSANPTPDPRAPRNRILLQGDVPSPANPPAGCHFHTRCHKCMAICSQSEPVLTDIGDGRQVACHLYAPKAATA